MGKLAELREKRGNMSWDHPDREKIEKEINRIERWMIDNKIGSIKEVTTWSKSMKKKGEMFSFGDPFENERYPHHVSYCWVEHTWMLKEFNGKQHLNRDGTPHHCINCS